MTDSTGTNISNNIPFAYPSTFSSMSNVQPFTYRDGVTYLEKLDNMQYWLNNSLLPAVQSMTADMDAAWATQYNNLVDLIANTNSMIDAAKASQTAAEAAATAAAGSAAQAGVQQDNAITALFNNLQSALRTATNLAYASHATQDTVENGRLSEASMADKADKTSVDDLVALTSTGRLAQDQLDARYPLKPAQPHAVFIGSSNAVSGTWPDQFSAAMGYVPHIFSIGGGGFTSETSSNFLTQAQSAVADNSYDHNLVKFVFICDMGNDIRATYSISANAPQVFATLKTAFPNARLILVPCMWGNATDNNISGRIVSLSQRVQEARNAGMPFNLEMVEWSWTWMGDANDWMKPGEVHYNVNGYQRISQFMQKYMAGASTRYDFGWKLIPPSVNVDTNTAYWRVMRDGNTGHIENKFSVPFAIPIDTDLGYLPYGTWPIDVVYANAITEGTRDSHSVAIFPNGTIRSLAAMPAENYHINVDYQVY